MTGYPQVNFNPYNMYQNWGYGYQYPVFRGVQNVPQPVNIPQPNVNLQTPPDTVSFRATEHIQTKPKKEGLSTGAKWGIGLGLTALAAGGIYLLSRGRTNNLNKLFNEKMVLSNLPENLTYKEAKTVEEGVKYAKEVLKIPTVDETFSLEAINYVNKSLVDVSNANKGKLLMPKSLRFAKMEGTVYADVCHDIKSNDFAQLTLNSNYFDDIFLTDRIKSGLKLAKHDVFSLKGKELWCPKILNPSEELKTLIMKHLTNQPMTIKEKRCLYLSLENAKSKLLNQYANSSQINVGLVAPETMIYHEMGHLQDYFVNLKKLMKGNSLKDVLSGALKDEKIEICDINNRFLRKRDLSSTYKNNPDLLKEVYPDLYEHLNNKSIQDIAGQVSGYSKESIGEFVAEVYSGLISGKKFSDDVMALYKKYGGPALT